MADPNVPSGSPTPRIEDSAVQSHPFKAHFHGREDGTPGYLAVESGYIVPGGFFGGFDAILPKFAGADLQDQKHTSELTHIADPPVGDYYIEATGEWRTTGYDGDNKIEMFEPHTAEVKHHSNLDLTHEKKRAMKIFRLESDGRIHQMIKSDIPMSLGRTTPAIPPWEEPPPPEPGSGSGSSSSSSSSSSGSSGSASGSDSTSGYKSAAFDEHDYPPFLAPGVTANVQVTMFNDGTLPWEATDQLIPVGYDWGLFSVPVPVTYPGVPRPFNFEIHAPMTPGTYPFSWRLYGPAAFYGEASPEVDITVVAPTSSSSAGSSGSTSAPPPYDRAAFVSQHVVPEEMFVDEEASVTVVFRNVGTTVWETGMYKILPMRHDWGNFEVPIPTRALPGVERSFDITMIAPSAPGTYWWRWAMYGPSGVFDQEGAEVPVIVSLRPGPPIPPGSGGSSSSSSSSPPDPGSGPAGGFHASFVSQIVPLDIPQGSTAAVSLQFRNIGTDAWVPSIVELRSQNPTDNTTWGSDSVPVPTLTLSGAERAFTFMITAPGSIGPQNFQWRLFNGFDYFGPVSPNRVIEVVPATGSGSDSSST